MFSARQGFIYAGQPTGFVSNGLLNNLAAWNSTSYPGSGTTWYDISGNNNNATLQNGPTYSSTPMKGVIILDGSNDYVQTGITTNPTNWTVEFGFQLATVPSSTVVQIGKFTDGGDNWWIGINGNKISWSHGGDFLVGPTLSANTNYLVTCVLATSSKTMYVNNSSAATGGSSRTGSASPANYIAIGRFGTWSQYYAPGKYSFFRYYNRDLTSAEVSANYTETLKYI